MFIQFNSLYMLCIRSDQYTAEVCIVVVINILRVGASPYPYTVTFGEMKSTRPWHSDVGMIVVIVKYED